MPHVNSSGGDDLTSTDEVKVYKDEGEDENRSSENLLEDKHELVTETEEEKRSDSLIGGYGSGGEKRSGDGKTPEPDRPGLPAGGYPLFSPYTYPNGATVPGSLGSKVPMVQPPHPSSLSSIMMYPSSEHLAQPPPAHMGIPPVHIDPKTGLPRPPMYAIPPPPGQFTHPLYSDISQMQWNGHPGYSMATGYRGPYPGLSNSPLSRFSPPGMLSHHPSMHPGMQHPAIITPGPKQEVLENHRRAANGADFSPALAEKRPKSPPKIKKPLNAFMLYMKQARAEIIAEGTVKGSSVINQLLGRKWHALDRSEQAKYYEMARKEKELHLQLYPGWSARDNYASNTKKKRKKREQQQHQAAEVNKNAFGQGFARSPPTIGYTTESYSGEYMLPNSGSTTSASTTTINNNNHHTSNTGFDLTSSPRLPQPQAQLHQPYGLPETQKECSNPKKCRARFGLDQQSQWCKPCRRKKKCIRFMTGEDGSGSDDDDDDDDEDMETGGSVATIDSTTDPEMGGGESSQGSPAPSSSSLLAASGGGDRGGAFSSPRHNGGGGSGHSLTSAALHGHHLQHGGSGRTDGSSGSSSGGASRSLQHPTVSQSQPASPPPPSARHHHLPPAPTSGSHHHHHHHHHGGGGGSGSGSSATGGGAGSSGGSHRALNFASMASLSASPARQNHSMSDSNQDSLHSTVSRASSGRSGNNSSTSSNVGNPNNNSSGKASNTSSSNASSSTNSRVSTVLAT